MSVFPRPGRRLGIGLVASVLALSAVAVSANATVRPGTPGKDVTVGLDNDNADNTFIQPPAVTAKQHMENTDLLFGRDNDDLLVGKLGSDVLLGGPGSDITVGGPEAFSAPNSDVMDGEEGADINIWAPGDGSELYVGERGYDVQVFAPFVTRSNGSLQLQWANGRRIPRVDIGGQPTLSCRIDPVPANQDLGVQFLARFLVNGNLTVTVRLKDVEAVLCPSPANRRATIADLSEAHPTFEGIRLNRIGGVLGAIVAPVS